MNKNDIQASPAQLRYADTLFYGSLIGFVIMLITYILYVTGILTPQIPLDELPHLWTGSAADYRAAGHIPQGWGWLSLIGKGEQILMRIDRVGRHMTMGQGMCGSLSGSVPTNVGQPTIRVSSLTVGGK